MKSCRKCHEQKPADGFYLIRGKPSYQCKECQKAYVKGRYLANPDPVKDRAKQWEIDNPERLKARKAEYYARTSDAAKSRARKWSESNPEKRVAIRASWVDRNPDLAKFSKKLSGGRRRKKIKENGVNITHEQLDAIMSLFGDTCAYCWKLVDEMTIDHFVPVAAGGKTEPGNLVPCCRSCNSKKSDMPPEDWMRKIGAEDVRGDGYFTVHQFLEISRQVFIKCEEAA
ncbi:HNH endonuclease [Rhizobium laguerreae]|uniref:HNH endonuclease n=1 Tax=Rhizobium laguerreae TaxID=1076926 RepID=UPI001C91D600|nr:HNH endonuclease [Rhizobium laguerreae]